MPMLSLLTGSFVLLASASPGLDIDRVGCSVERITVTGQHVAEPAAQARTSGDGRSASASASSRGETSSSSSVSASSSSNGPSTSRSVATSTDAQGRTVTTIHENGRCTITIDERPASGGTP